jgi:hypothetical protein
MLTANAGQCATLRVNRRGTPIVSRNGPFGVF